MARLHVGLFTLITFTFDVKVYKDGLLRISVFSK